MTDHAPDVVDDGAEARVAALAGAVVEGGREGTGLRIGVVCARFNESISMRLLEGCLAGLCDARVDAGDVTVAWVPGAFELPVAAQAMATARDAVDAVVCLGAVIRGETGHYDVVAGECARGIQDVAIDTGVPVILGVLTCDTVAQAMARSQPDETNKGREAAVAAVQMARLLDDPRLA